MMAVMVFLFLFRNYLPSCQEFFGRCHTHAHIRTHAHRFFAWCTEDFLCQPPGCLGWFAFACGCGSGRLSIRGALARGALVVVTRILMDTWKPGFGFSTILIFISDLLFQKCHNYQKIWLHGATHAYYIDIQTSQILRRVCNVWKLNCRVWRVTWTSPWRPCEVGICGPWFLSKDQLGNVSTKNLEYEWTWWI